MSCTDEPEWAAECLNKFLTSQGDPIKLAAHSSQIFKADKKQHFRNLKQQYPDIQFEEMLFFDNEISNIRSVSQLGVKTIFCPDGVSQDIWQKGLQLFSE